MKVSLVWSSPRPDMTVAVAMRRCYSTKTIEEIEAELEQKGAEYWKYLLSKAMQDKSLDVLEHFTMSLEVEGMPAADAGALAIRFPFLRMSDLGGGAWLVTLNARTLVELWRDARAKQFAGAVVAELDGKNVCPVLSGLAFGGKANAG